MKIVCKKGWFKIKHKGKYMRQSCLNLGVFHRSRMRWVMEETLDRLRKVDFAITERLFK